MQGDVTGIPRTLMPQFLSWCAARPRSHAEAMDAWRSNCPRLSVWEDALAEGLLRVEGEAQMVRLTEAGRARLAAG